MGLLLTCWSAGVVMEVNMAENFLPISRLHDALESLVPTSELKGNLFCARSCVFFFVKVYRGERKMYDLFYKNAWQLWEWDHNVMELLSPRTGMYVSLSRML